MGTVSDRALRAQMPAASGDEELAALRSRPGTLVPLLSAVGKSSILALELLSVLVSAASTSGQSSPVSAYSDWRLVLALEMLVKDVVSGLFFLIDDAFRFGEYIETSGAKGTVEKISVRSVSLPPPRGALATVLPRSRTALWSFAPSSRRRPASSP